MQISHVLSVMKRLTRLHLWTGSSHCIYVPHIYSLTYLIYIFLRSIESPDGTSDAKPFWLLRLQISITGWLSCEFWSLDFRPRYSQLRWSYGWIIDFIWYSMIPMQRLPSIIVWTQDSTAQSIDYIYRLYICIYFHSRTGNPCTKAGYL